MTAPEVVALAVALLCAWAARRARDEAERVTWAIAFVVASVALVVAGLVSVLGGG